MFGLVSDFTLFAGFAVVAIVVISALQYRAAKGRYRPLSSRQPQRPVAHKPELGMEAIDMAGVRRTQRSNESLERVNNIWAKHHGATKGLDTSVDAMPDDETYARRFHAAFMKNKD